MCYCKLSCCLDLEVDTKVDEESTVVRRSVVDAIGSLPLVNVHDAELIASLQIELVVLCTAAQLDAHVETLEAVVTEGVDLTYALGLHLTTETKTEGGTYEGQHGDVVAHLHTILNKDGEL